MILLLGGSGCWGDDNWRLYWELKTLSFDLGLGVRLEESMGRAWHLFLHGG